MKKPPIPKNENQRLEALKEYDVLDSAPEQAFDDITKLASNICGTKVALVSLVDKDRQWFKSAHCLDAKETLRDISYCGHTILSDEVLVIEDASKDERFKTNPLHVGPPYVRFYAGAPLTTPDGYRIGTLCVLDDQPKKLTESQIESLQILARSVINLLELRKTNAQLESTKEQSVEIQHISMTGGWELDVSTMKTKWSDYIYEIYGIPIGTPMDKVDGISYYAKHERARLEKYISDCISKKQTFNEVFEFYDANDNKKFVRSIGKPVMNKNGTVTHLVGTIQDVTESHKIFEKLRVAQKISKLGHWEFDVKKQEITWSEMMFEIFPEDIENGAPSFERHQSTIHPEDLDLWSSTVQSCLESGEPYVMEFRCIDPDDPSYPTKWLKAHGEANLDADGNVVELNGTCQDITEEKRMREKIDKASAFLSNTINNIPSVIYAKDVDGKFILVNETFRKLLELDNTEILGKTNHDLFPKDLADQFRENDLEIIRKRKVIESEEIAVGADGKKRFYHSFKFPYFTDSGKVFATGGVSLDITERKELQKQAFHSKKLASIGELAAGVGHEINNPLAIVKGYVTNLIAQINKTDGIDLEKSLQQLRKIDIATDRIVAIVKGLRTFSRTDDSRFESFDFVDPLYESINLVKEIYKNEGIALSVSGFNENTGMCPVHGSRGRLQQVFMNLLSNAKDACERSKNPSIEVSLTRQDGSVRLSISDNGIGIDTNHQEKVFDPFFTTKEINKGTGIGLSLAHTIIKEHNGRILFETTPGVGTSFMVEIPLTEKGSKTSNSDSNTRIDKQISKRKGSILIVEDEEGLREIIAEVLASEGFQVTEAANGREAIDFLESRPSDFELVLTDMKMPEVSGAELISWMRSKPKISSMRCIAVTGGINVNFEDPSDPIGSMFDGFILKPFSPEELVETVANCLKTERELKSTG